MVFAGIGTCAGATAESSVKLLARRTPGMTRRLTQLGKASWYGGRFNGQRTATGERYDMRAMTCAHRSLPFGSWLRVTNVRNHKAVFVRVNDRGPVSENLLLDLSFAAAQKIGISGVAKVRMESLRTNDPDLVRFLHPAKAAPSSYLELALTSEGIPVLAPSVAFR